MIDLRTRTKDCSTCKETLSVSEFSRNGSGHRSNCKNCARKSKAEWHVRHRAEDRSKMQNRRLVAKEYVWTAKQDPCVDCGRKYHPSLMDFDHINADNKVNSVSTIAALTMSITKVQEEIDKCELVCCMCHRIRTWNRLYPNNLISL